MQGAGEGKVDNKKLSKTLELWGKMPEKDKIKALEAISRDLPPHYREQIEAYRRELAKGTGGK
jgi:hypothetical protein